MRILLVFHDAHLIEDYGVEVAESSQRGPDALSVFAGTCLDFSIETAHELLHPFSFDLGLGNGVGNRVVPVEFEPRGSEGARD